MKKILITGPESSGKTTIAQDLTKQLQATMVPEFSRIYLEKLNRPYREEDLLEIAKGQNDWLQKAIALEPQFLIADTALIVMKVWGEVVFENVHPWILQQLEKQHFDHIFLCHPSIPWEPDPLRENPDNRLELFDKYENSLKNLNWNYHILKGPHQPRLTKALHIIK